MYDTHSGTLFSVTANHVLDPTDHSSYPVNQPYYNQSLFGNPAPPCGGGACEIGTVLNAGPSLLCQSNDQNDSDMGLVQLFGSGEVNNGLVGFPGRTLSVYPAVPNIGDSVGLIDFESGGLIVCQYTHLSISFLMTGLDCSGLNRTCMMINQMEAFCRGNHVQHGNSGGVVFTTTSTCNHPVGLISSSQDVYVNGQFTGANVDFTPMSKTSEYILGGGAVGGSNFCTQK